MALDPVSHTPMSPNYHQLAMDQCGLRHNEQGKLVPTNTKSLCSSPPTTIEFQALNAMPTGLDLGVARELHHTLVAQL